MRLTRRGAGPAISPFDRLASSRNSESDPVPVMLGTRLVDATLRGAMKAGMGTRALLGTVSAEAVALMEGIIKSMTNAKLMLVMAAVLISGLLTSRRGSNGIFCESTRTSPQTPASGARDLASRLQFLRSHRARPAPMPPNGPGSKSSDAPIRSRRFRGSPLVGGRCRRDGLVAAGPRNRPSSKPRPTARGKCSSNSLGIAGGRPPAQRPSWHTNPGRRLPRRSCHSPDERPVCHSPDSRSTGGMYDHRRRPRRSANRRSSPRSTLAQAHGWPQSRS